MATLSPVSGSPASIKNEDASSPKPTVTIAAPVTKANKPKSRKRVNTAEKRHQHNAIERQRRETLNGKFLSLARLLPSLASHRRPSKSAIVNGSISHLTHQRNQRLLAAKLLRQVCSERDELLAEVNEWRKASGFATKDAASAWTSEMDEIAKVEQETFGNFASVGGDNGDDDEGQNNDNEEDDAVSGADRSTEMNIERASVIAASFSNNGLITPRSSTDLDAVAHVNALYGNAPVHVQQRPTTATSAPAPWSSDFLFGVSNQSSNVPFNAFMSDSLSADQSASDSPLSFQGSATGNMTGATSASVLTPPTTADMVYGHTPSPRSSSSGHDDVKVVPSQGTQWTAQQMLYLQQQVQQQNLQRQQQQSALAAQQSAVAAAAAAFMPGLTNGFQGYNGVPAMGQQPHVSGSGPTDAFTQSLMASMFPQQRDLANLGIGLNQNMGSGMSADQVQQWRQLALGGLMQHGHQGGARQSIPGVSNMDQPSMADLKNAVRHGMGLGMGMAGVWPEGGQQHHTVEGF